MSAWLCPGSLILSKNVLYDYSVHAAFGKFVLCLVYHSICTISQYLYYWDPWLTPNTKSDWTSFSFPITRTHVFPVSSVVLGYQVRNLPCPGKSILSGCHVSCWITTGWAIFISMFLDRCSMRKDGCYIDYISNPIKRLLTKFSPERPLHRKIWQ